MNVKFNSAGRRPVRWSAVERKLNVKLAADTEMTCGNCAQRIGEECEAHGGREVYADDDKPEWCDEWAVRT